MTDIVSAVSAIAFIGKGINIIDKLLATRKKVNICIQNYFDRPINVHLSRDKENEWVQIQPGKEYIFKFRIKILGITSCYCKVQCDEEEKWFSVYGDDAPRQYFNIYELHQTHVVENGIKRFDWSGWVSETSSATPETVLIDETPAASFSHESIHPEDEPVHSKHESIYLKSDDFLDEKIPAINSENVDLNYMNKDGFTLLHIYAKDGNLISAKELIEERHFPVNVSDYSHQQPIHLAAEHGHYKILELLVKNKANVNALANSGLDEEDALPSTSPLHLSCCYGRADCVKFLLDNGVKINQRDNNGLSALHWAVKQRYDDVIKLLLTKKYNANIDIFDKDGQTPLHYTCQNGKFSIMELLLEHGAYINAKDKDDLTPIHLACFHENLSFVVYLVEKQADINVATKNGTTPLLLACGKGNYEIAKFLLENDAKINALNENGWSPIHCGSQLGHYKIVKTLLEKEAQINLQNNDGDTPLHVACHHLHPNIIQLLLNYGPDTTIVNKDGKTAFDLALEAGFDNLFLA